ncbi:3443_t:CDS:2 [Acaulospora colombiana]|uniref:3443_t:CDS:1 n=1 Tax=Acaulospora colombiana TaxID=27376 RepID=A0ACA9KJ30_9GLOM|nr:3443_t:CDS:2 [Acaulospora colombiana]
MSTSTRAEVLSLYRSFLRVIERWPTDYLRPNRNLRQVLHLRVVEGFRQNLIIKDADVFSSLISEANVELDALRRLADNEYKEKYPLSDRIYRPAANPKYYSGLVAAIDKAAKQKQEEESRPSFWKRLWGENR